MSAAGMLVVGSLAALALAWLVADIFFYATGRETITRFIIRASERHIAVPFLAGLLLGLLLGHLFLQF